MAEYKKGNRLAINGSTLKIIAIISMIIDHTGVALWYRLQYMITDLMAYDQWFFIYRCMRNIGRTAFPIYCFLLVEGFFHTSNRLKYGIRLLLFAMLSQLPFHFAFLDLINGLNVFFTLFLGLVVIGGLEETEKRLAGQPIFAWCGKLLLSGVVGYLATALHTDYGWKGIGLIVLFYLFYRQRLLALITGYLLMIGNAFCFPAFFLINFYNGKRGIGLKYLFYLVYPLHLSVLYVIWRYLL